jgi:hypothetical protein
MKRLAVVVTALLLAACANPYEKFYHGTPDGRALPGYQASAAPIQLYSTDNFARDVQLLQSKGFGVIGNSSFNAGSNAVSERQVRSQAEKVGAQVVLVSSKYTNTVTGAVPLNLPQTSTSYSTGTATAYGPAGTATAYGSGTTTTYGTQTVMMPYSIDRSDFGAVYMAKFKTRIGVMVEALDDQTRKRLDTNFGVRVRVVIEGSPAYAAGIFPGDVLLAISGESVQSVDYFRTMVPKYSGQLVKINLDRDGTRIEKSVQFLSD